MPSKELEELVNQYEATQKQIMKILETLPAAGSECTCKQNDRTRFPTIHEGNWNEIINYCLECGGTIDE